MVRATEADVARALSADGAALVLVDEDGGRAGALAREIIDAGGRAVVFVGDATDETGRSALAEMISELFP